jgi:hypothetical protein
VLAIVAGWDFQNAHESGVHLFFTAVATRIGDRFNAIVGFLETPAGSIRANPLHVSLEVIRNIALSPRLKL